MIPVVALLALAAGGAYAAHRYAALRTARNTEAGKRKTRTGLETANEGLLDHELLSTDPIGAWLSRYLTPTAG